MTAAVTSEYIVNTLQELLTQTKIENLTIKELTAHCQVSRSTIYRNFPGGMYDLSVAVLARDVQKCSLLEINNWHQLMEYIVNYILQNKCRSQNIYQLIVMQNQQQCLSQFMQNFLYSFIKTQAASEKLLSAIQKYPEETAFVMNGVLYSVHDWFIHELKISPEIITKKLDFAYQIIQNMTQFE